MIIDSKNKKKKNNLYDEAIENYKIDISKFLFNEFQSTNDSIRFFESLPFGKELKKAFGKMSSRLPINEKSAIDLIYLKSFMENFYKTLLISIDKKSKTFNDFGFDDVKKAVYKKENHKELKKALNIFNCKIQNHYFEFSKNGLIELYTQYEYLNLIKFLELKTIEGKNEKPKTSSLKSDSKAIKIYREIIKRVLFSKINNKVIYREGKENISAHIFDVADENNEDIKKLENRFYKWTRDNQEKFKIIIYQELDHILKHQPS